MKTSVPIICFNPNPAVELTGAVERLEIGAVNRTSGFTSSASGKASNVARTIKNLSFEALMVGPLAGQNGETFINLLNAEGLIGEWVWIEGETRTNITIIERATQRDTIVNGAGPKLTIDDFRKLEEMLLVHSSAAEPVCISGSLPQGLELTDVTKLVRRLTEQGSHVFVDASGDALEAMLQATPWCAKFNQAEAQGLLNREVTSLDEVVAAAVELSARVESLLLITMGAAGVVLVEQGKTPIYIQPPKIEAVSGVGSGDTFLGAFLVGLYRMGKSPVQSAAFAAAAGAVNATSARQGDVSIEQILDKLHEVEIRTLDDHQMER